MVFGRYDYAAFSCFLVYAAGSVVIPIVLVSLARDLGFSLEQGGMTAGGALHFGRTIPMVASMLFCGFIGGRWGKRQSFGLSIVVTGIGMGLCALAPGYGILFAALVVAGAGEGIIEGLATPFIQDLHPDEPGRYINFTHAFWSVGVLVTVLLTGLLLVLGISWRLIIGGVALLATIPAALLLLPAGRGAVYPDSPTPTPWRTVLGQAGIIVRKPRFWIFFAAMFVAGGGEFCLTFWSASHIQLHFAGSAWTGGFGTACFALGMVVGRIGWGYLVKQSQLGNLVIGSALAGTLVTLCFPWLNDLGWFLGLLFLAGVATAPFWPSIQSYCTNRLPECDTTMLFILLSCAGVPGCGVFTLLMGFLGNRGGLAAAFYLVPACYLILGLLVVAERWSWRDPAAALHVLEQTGSQPAAELPESPAPN